MLGCSLVATLYFLASLPPLEQVMTPFELYLESELNVEWQRFANDWLFKWHGMTYEAASPT
jgi:hypothetical protein